MNNILKAMKDALPLIYGATSERAKVYENLKDAIEEMERAEPVAWSLWQPFGGHVQFTGNQKLATQYGLRADVMVTPLYLHPTTAIPEGWQLVPKSTTCDMDSAGSKAHYKNWDGSPTVTESDAESIYKAMLAAAPEYKP